MEKHIRYRHNVLSINSINTFFNIHGGYTNDIRDVYFVRGIGEPENIDSVISEIDSNMNEEMSKQHLHYVRIDKLNGFNDTKTADYYAAVYDKIMGNQTFELKNISMTQNFKTVFCSGFYWIVKKYSEVKNNASLSMIRNFGTKILYWLDGFMGEALKDWNERLCIKVVADNVLKEQEYLFYLFLTQIGCDVFLFENQKDIVLEEEVLKYSKKLYLGNYGNSAITPYSQRQQIKKKDSVLETDASDYGKNNIEKSIEELAKLASSVVLIMVHDKAGETYATGSGIMIGENGYILTNCHVLSGGSFFSIRIEDDENIYKTDEIIKYNQSADLAIIRIDKQLQPLQVYRGKKRPVRGQKVVAIGSPLGLFNSVSDGIISGFRNIGDTDMIQFTAPTSHGSSGGALLNMQGEVIGISTAGIDSGQNINLAVGYENILTFAKGFI